MAIEFECPVAEEDTQPYTTEECGDCFCLWDCETGLEQCLKDDDFKEYHEEFKRTLQELQQ